MLRWLKGLMIRWQYNGSRRYFSRHPDHVAVCWNGLTGSRRAFMAGARDAGAARLFAELAPLPGRITLDPRGVNAENSLPRERGFYEDWAMAQGQRDWQGWRDLGRGMVARPSRRADVGQGGGEALDGSGPFLFCPLQVPDDSQVRLFSGWCGDMPGFIAALAKATGALPEGWHLRVKEHPSARQSLGPALSRAATDAGGRMVVDNTTDTFAQLAASQAVVTLNSSVGLQAFFHDKPVIVVGQAFFAIPGLVHPVPSQDALNAAFTRPEALGFDADFRDRFMSYLAEVYYPSDRLDPGELARKLAEARQVASLGASGA
ncbi:MAG: capsular biosynthesis protein [Paracoccaceae bacterium]